MRVDVLMSDNINYHDISLIEIEPYACGKGPSVLTRACIKHPDNIYIYPDKHTTTTVALAHIIAGINLNNLTKLSIKNT